MALPLPQNGSIAIIGAGPGGLAAAKYLRAENPSWRITIFEQSGSVGGVWQHDHRAPASLHRVPLEDPRGPTGDGWLREELAVASPGGTKVNGEIGEANGVRAASAGEQVNGRGEHGPASAPPPDFLTPMYDDLETNLPKQIMCFSDQDFDDSLPLFPPRADVLRYLERYADDVATLIIFHAKVVNAEPAPAGSGTGWLLEIGHEGGQSEAASFDAVVVATGHYNVPSLPAIPGLVAWNDVFPGSIQHSKFYRNPRAYRGRRVVVVGNAASGLDIAHHLAPEVAKPLYVSARSAVSAIFAGGGPSPDVAEVAQIASLDPHARPPAITLTDGTQLENIDRILFCTGYHHSYPFLDALSARHSLPPVVTDGLRTRSAYRHIFYRADPTLAFVGLGQKFVPFPTVEGQSAVTAAVWSGRVDLCGRDGGGQEGMRAWEEKTLAEAIERKGEKDFHSFAFPEDARYLEDCAAWAQGDFGQGPVPSAKRAASRKVSPTWDARMYWVREKIPPIKHAFNELGERRHHVRNMEELGFVFDCAAREEVRELYGKQ